MRVDEFDFDLPESAIALRPASPRDGARMLEVLPDGVLEDRHVGDLPDLLSPGDAMVFNDTRVVHARLFGLRRRDDTAARIEATLHRRLDDHRWCAFARPAKRLRAGDAVAFGDDNSVCMAGHLNARVEHVGEGGEVTLAFELSGPFLDDAMQAAGVMPLPPYIASKRPADSRDETDYQTVYADAPGAVAAPTAGLHFTPRLLDALDARGISRHFVTLHVGAGTFLPVKSEDTSGHRMHAENGTVSASVADALNAVRARGGRIVAVGTTSLRLLESAADPDGTLHAFDGATDIFITPGYRFRTADLLMTNFHLPRSTLFMLVSAFGGTQAMKRAYAHAIAEGYRFYSYGDASLLHRAEGS